MQFVQSLELGPEQLKQVESQAKQLLYVTLSHVSDL